MPRTGSLHISSLFMVCKVTLGEYGLTKLQKCAGSAIFFLTTSRMPGSCRGGITLTQILWAARQQAQTESYNMLGPLLRSFKMTERRYYSQKSPHFIPRSYISEERLTSYDLYFSSKVRQLDTIHKLASFIVPKRVARFETSLVTGIEDDSETIQNIAEDFSLLMSRYHILFLWEQLRTDMKYTMDYIVDRESAAPILDGTDRCGIAADHRGICKFQIVDSPGFKVVIVALKRYCMAATARIKERLMESAISLSEKRRYEAMELVGETPVSPIYFVSNVSSFSDVPSLSDTINRLRMKRDAKGSS
ncbi:hypothetical protein N7465_003898 [Penicillium sp. CMV-2018d]|nr:hypothetical protein N7465_003898 [Penicillium sp. CMV-2018d]